MNLTQLQYFQKLAQLEHYTNTAKELFISQPSLSVSIAALEEELQVKLFQKQGRNVRLTSEGQKFYHHVCNALDALQVGIDAIREKEETPRGTITLAAQPFLLLEQIPELIRRYKKETNAPQIHFAVHAIPSASAILDGVEAGAYDCGFCVNPAQRDGVAASPALPQHAVAIVQKKHPLAKKKQCMLSELFSFPIAVHPKDSAYGAPFWNWLESRKIQPALLLQEDILIGSYISQWEQLVAVTAAGGFAGSNASLAQIPILDLPPALFTASLLYCGQGDASKPLRHFLSYLQIQ